MISYRKNLGQSSLTADGLVLEDDGDCTWGVDKTWGRPWPTPRFVHTHVHVSSKHDRATALDGGLIRLGRGVLVSSTRGRWWGRFVCSVVVPTCSHRSERFTKYRDRSLFRLTVACLKEATWTLSSHK